MILSPKLTVSTSGFGGSARYSGDAFSYDPTATLADLHVVMQIGFTGRTSISIAFAGSSATMHGKSSWGDLHFRINERFFCVGTISAIYGNTRFPIRLVRRPPPSRTTLP